MRKQANIGTTSLILIFVILCLSTFGLLSLSSAKGDLSLAEKNAKAVQTYYEADAAGETFVQMVHQVFREAKEQKLAGARREVISGRSWEAIILTVWCRRISEWNSDRLCILSFGQRRMRNTGFRAGMYITGKNMKLTGPCLSGQGKCPDKEGCSECGGSDEE